MLMSDIYNITDVCMSEHKLRLRFLNLNLNPTSYQLLDTITIIIIIDNPPTMLISLRLRTNYVITVMRIKDKGDIDKFK